MNILSHFYKYLMVLFELIINCECENIDAITTGKDYEYILISISSKDGISN